MGGITMWIARNENSMLHAYETKPVKSKRLKGYWVCGTIQVKLPSHWFPEVQWSDKEPRELILK